MGAERFPLFFHGVSVPLGATQRKFSGHKSVSLRAEKLHSLAKSRLGIKRTLIRGEGGRYTFKGGSDRKLYPN